MPSRKLRKRRLFCDIVDGGGDLALSGCQDPPPGSGEERTECRKKYRKKYGKKYRIRFLFNKSKKVTGIIYFYNYSKVPVK